MVGKTTMDMIHVIGCLLKERSHVLIIHRIIERGTFAPSFDQTAITQKPEMMGDARLRGSNGYRQIADTQGLTRQRIQDACACWIREGLKRLHNQQELSLGKRLALRSFNALTINAIAIINFFHTSLSLLYVIPICLYEYMFI